MWRLVARTASSQPRAVAPRRQVSAISRRALSSWACMETPNPDVRKFEWPVASAQQAPAAATISGARGQLLEVEGVQDVFAGAASGAPWLSVTRARGEDWDSLAPRVQAVLQGLPFDGAAVAEEEEASEATPRASGVEAEIEEVLEHRIRPTVQADGGDVELLRFNPLDGEVVLKLKGACRGCPQSAVTLQETILRTLSHYLPVVQKISAEEDLEVDVDDPFADLPFAHDGQPDPKGIQALAAGGTPFFSTFAGMKIEGRLLKRVKFVSKLALAGRKPGHIFVSCQDCKARRTIEDPNDLLREDKGNTTGNAAIVICPSCAVLISK